ncbi:MAG: DUF4185 domain-containing protein [bacterium]|nr:DUF4185 domain-containing protein [bacterium]
MLKNIRLYLVIIYLICNYFYLTPNGYPEIAYAIKVDKIARLTGTKGSDSINPTWEVDIGGVDLGSMMYFQGTTYFLFGDSFSSEGPGDGWRWNTMAYSSDTVLTDGITFDGWITDKSGRAREIIRDTRMNPITNIPTGGICINNKLYVWYMTPRFWGSKEDPVWQSHFAGLAWSDNFGQSFQIQEDFQFPSNTNFGMVAAASGNDDPNLNDGYVYLWGTPPNRHGGVKLARVNPNEITNIKSYQFFGGLKNKKPVWIKNEFEAPLIVQPRVGEMSVMYNRWANVWMMLHDRYNPLTMKKSSSETAGDIVLRQSPTPWGPWSEPIVLIPSSTYNDLAYGSYLNPHYVENNGESVYFIMSLWIPYDVYLMKATFRKMERNR